VPTTLATNPTEKAADSTERSRALDRLAFVVGAAAIYLAAWFYTDGLSFPIYEDEAQFWKLTLDFARDWPPSIEEIRTYPEPMTPLSFLMFGFVEHLFGGGIAAGRLFNFLLSFAMLCVVAFYRGDDQRHKGTRQAVLAAVGLIVYPYFLPMGMHLYTDLPAAFFVLMAFRMPARSIARGLFLLLAVATRQYMFIFPVALLLDELHRAHRTGQHRQLALCLPDTIAAVSLIGWIFFFGGLGPDAGLTEWPRHLESLGILSPMLGLHCLSTIGIYFVLPEFVLFRRFGLVAQLQTRKSLVIAVVLIVFYFIDPPIFGALKQGFFGRVADYLPVLPRMAVFFFFAWIACVRFARISLPFWILALQLVIVLNAYSAWEKYVLPVVAAFWLMKAMGNLDDEVAPDVQHG